MYIWIVSIIITASVIISLSIIIAIRNYYRHTIEKKNRALTRTICEEARLSKDMERIKIEKELLEKMIKIFIESFERIKT